MTLDSSQQGRKQLGAQSRNGQDVCSSHRLQRIDVHLVHLLNNGPIHKRAWIPNDVLQVFPARHSANWSCSNAVTTHHLPVAFTRGAVMTSAMVLFCVRYWEWEACLEVSMSAHATRSITNLLTQEMNSGKPFMVKCCAGLLGFAGFFILEDFSRKNIF